MTTTEPAHIGPYEIVRELGRGGMGIVYLARDARLARDVAIKAIPPELAADPGRLARFEREARALAHLSHPGIAAIHAVEVQEGRHYLILEFVPGETLASRLRRGALPIDEAVDFAIEIARAVEAAHDAGVIHRDLKPDNIAITPDHHIKVLDFGLAKPLTDESTPGSTSLPTATTPHSPTIPGAIMGTAGYMSPEQARGRPADVRTDVWAFGAVLYEMLTATNPFAGETIHDTIGAVLHKDADFTRLPPGTPAGARRVIARCLTRDKTRRYHAIADARLDLEESRHDAASSADTAARRSAFPLGWIVAALVAIAALAWQFFAQAPAASTLVHTAVVAPQDVRVIGFSISPDGSRIAMTGRPAVVGPDVAIQISTLYLRDLADERFSPVPLSEGVLHHAFSPDGRTLAFVTRGATDSGAARLMVMPADASTPPTALMIVPPEAMFGPSDSFCWTPQGEIALVGRNSRELVIYDSGTGEEIRRVALDLSASDPQIGALHGPFGGHHISISSMEYTPTGFLLHSSVIDTHTGSVHRILDDARFIGLTPNGEVLSTRRSTLYAAPFDMSELRVSGASRPVQTGLRSTAVWSNGDCDVSNSGSMVYLAGGTIGQQRRLEHIGVDGESTPWFDERRPFDEDIAISPDGSRVAVVIAGPGGLYEVWVSETDRPRLRRLVAVPGADCASPVFTPDGGHIVFGQWNPDTSLMDIVSIVPFDGSEPPRQIAQMHDAWHRPNSVSADGRAALVVGYAQSGNATLWLVPLDGASEPRSLVELHQIYDARLPPVDLPLVAYIATDTGRAEAAVRLIRDTDLGPPIPVTTRGAWGLEWVDDDKRGLGIMHFDYAWREWFTPITVENGRIRVGDATPTGRSGDAAYISRAYTRRGECIAIRKGEDERPATSIELVQNWLSSIESP